MAGLFIFDMAGFVVLLLLAGAYFLPTLLAAYRYHTNTTAIFVLNLLLGWTMIGWIVALVWAFTKPNPSAVLVPRTRF
jgi:hypothetical protein